ncbi:MAG: hypothetical protein IJ733_09530 [Lachnospiraceae bacterium]|nr:hypothetical protein [Lachnospiraceae bacterium]
MKKQYLLLKVLVLAVIMVAVAFYLEPTSSKAKVKSTDGEYSVDVSDVFWVGGDEEWFRVEDSEGFLIELESFSQSQELFSVNPGFAIDGEEGQFYEFYILPVKSGKTTVTVTFTQDNVKREASFELKVKKYPNAIKSLTVNKSKVKVAAKVKRDFGDEVDQRFSFHIRTARQYGTIKMSLKKGWKISNVKGIYCIGSDYFKTKKISNKTITDGKKISFKKTWEELWVIIQLKNTKGDVFAYTVCMEHAI